MSINFNQPIDDSDQEFVRKFLKDDLVALDKRTALFNTETFDTADVGERIAEKTHQAVTIEVNHMGETKTMSDGTKYQVTAEGWVKL